LFDINVFNNKNAGATHLSW